MSYDPTTWQTGDIVTADKLNNIENGILGVETETSQLKSQIAEITVPSTNRLNMDALTAEYVDTSGNVVPSANYYLTDYIPVTAGETIYWWSARGDGDYYYFDSRMMCAYDASKVAIPSAGAAWVGGNYTVPANVAYVRLDISKSYIDGTWTDFYLGSNTVGVGYEPYGVVHIKSDEAYTISNGGSILEGVMYCYANGFNTLVVEAGTYDIIAEYKAYYGNDYFDNYINYAQGNMYDAGIWLENISVKFSPAAKVVCKYTGENTAVPAYFSAFATGNNVTIEGLVLDSENLRYGIHADFNSGADLTYFVVKNCDLKHYKNSESMQAIGAGFGIHVDWLIENTIFRSAGGSDKVFRVHNNVNSAAQSRLTMRNCYIDGDGYFKFNSYSTSTAQSIVQVCGCSYATAPVVGKESAESTDNVTMIAWNNELRS